MPYLGITIMVGRIQAAMAEEFRESRDEGRISAIPWMIVVYLAWLPFRGLFLLLFRRMIRKIRKSGREIPEWMLT